MAGVGRRLGLLALPPEILLQVAELLDHTSSLHLLVTCRTLHSSLRHSAAFWRSVCSHLREESGGRWGRMRRRGGVLSTGEQGSTKSLAALAPLADKLKSHGQIMIKFTYSFAWKMPKKIQTVKDRTDCP